MFNQHKFANAVRTKRENDGLTLMQLEDMLPGLSKSTISRIEKGEYSCDTTHFLIILNWLNMPAHLFITKEEAVA